MNTLSILTPRIPALTSPLGAALTLLAVLLFVGCDSNPLGEASPASVDLADASEARARPFAVSGSAVHFLSTAVVHSQEPTANGMVQRSTDVIELRGDLSGYVLYHPTSVFDFEAGTLVNTGTQIFSGTVAGSAPVILHDDTFRFEVDLATGATTGVVYLGRSKDAPLKGTWYECTLDVVGTGVTPEGDNLSDYTGECTLRGSAGHSPARAGQG